MTNNRLQTSTMHCYRVDWIDLEHEIPRQLHVADVTDSLPAWRIAQLVQEWIGDDGLVTGIRDKGKGFVITHNQVEKDVRHTSLAREEADFYRVELQVSRQRLPSITYVANASDDVPLWRIAELFQDQIDKHRLIVAIDDVRVGLALLPAGDPGS